MADVAALPAEEGRATWLGHPRGLFVLFFAEMWERFSYYGMRALLIFYLTKHWLFSDGEASVIYGAYTALVYITPVMGGYLADRWLGQRKAVLYGAVLLSFGHLMMAVEGDGTGGASDPAVNVFWLALAFIIVGSGFLKANISTIVGQLYRRTDPRRDPAYTIFYIGINLGAFMGALVAGWLGETYGWSYGFGAAGIGMLLGLIVFVIGKPWLEGRGESRDPAALKKPVLGIPLEWVIYIGGVLMVGVIWWLIQNQGLVGGLLGGFGALLIGYVVFTAVTKLGAQDRDRIFAAMFLILGSILFWALFEQHGSSINLFTDRFVDRTVGGTEIPASVFQSVNSGFIILLGPLFAALWLGLAKRGWEPSSPAKFGVAMLLVGASFLVLVWGAASSPELVPVFFIFALYFLATAGELCLSPVGLSAMNRLAPAHMASLMMGMWFFASATGNFAAGLISKATGGDTGTATRESVLAVYSNVGWLGIGAGVFVLLISPLVKKLMHLDTLADDHLPGEAEIGEPMAAGVRPGKVG